MVYPLTISKFSVFRLEFRETPASPQMLADMMRLELGREQAERKRMQQLVKTLRSENSTLQQLQAQSALPGAELQTASAREVCLTLQHCALFLAVVMVMVNFLV